MGLRERQGWYGRDGEQMGGEGGWRGGREDMEWSEGKAQDGRAVREGVECVEGGEKGGEPHHFGARGRVPRSAAQGMVPG